MKLTSPPVEILWDVITDLIPESFEDFALTCKYTYQASKAFIEKYNLYRKKYRYYPDRETFIATSKASFLYSAGRFQFRFPNEEYTGSHIPTNKYMPAVRKLILLLQDIAQDPIVARYVIFADLGFLHYECNNIKSIEQKIPQMRWERSLKDLVRKTLSTYLDGNRGACDEWLSYIRYEINPGFKMMLLLALLPNVEELIATPFPLDHTARSEAMTSKLLRAITARAEAEPCSAVPLSKLEKLHHIDTFATCGLSLITPFFSLPRLCRFRAANLSAQFDQRACDLRALLPRGLMLSNLETLELYRSFFHPLEFRQDFRNMKRLRSVKLYFGGREEYFVRMLMEERSDSIEDLSVLQMKNQGSRGILPGYYVVYAANMIAVADMTGFSRLKSLELDTQLLLGSPITAEDLQGESLRYNSPEKGRNKPPRRFRHPDNDVLFKKYEKTIPPPVELLPRSLETLTLADGLLAGTSLFKRLFLGFAEQNAEKLPHLHQVTIYIGGLGLESHGKGFLPRELKDAGKVVDLVLVRQCLHSKIGRCT